MKIVICGSMSAAPEMIEAKRSLTLLGHNVVMPEFIEKYAAMQTRGQMAEEAVKNKVDHDLIRDHYFKIQTADAIVVVNMEKKGVIGYIGGNTFLEIGFAHVLDKKIFLYNPIPEIPYYKTEIEAMKPLIINGDFSKIK